MTREDCERLAEALRVKFGGTVEYEPVNDAGRYRFAVVSPRFENMAHLERQDAIWPIVDQTLDRAATIDVSLILAYAPTELTAAE